MSKKIRDAVADMGGSLETVYTDEHSFFEEEFLDKMQEEYSFETSFVQLGRLQERLEAGRGILSEMEKQKAERESLLKEYDTEKKARSTMERRIDESEKALVELCSLQKEAIYDWQQSNEELKLDKEQMQEINRFLDQYELRSDYHEVKNIVSNCYFRVKGDLSQDRTKLETEKNETATQLDELSRQLQEWKNQKDPEPEVAPAVLKNRERLTELGIPYHRFYETVEFEEGMDDAQADVLEESLAEMGVLDALIVDASYRKQVLACDPGNCDKYIFTDAPYQNSNLSEMLYVGEDYNDLFTGPQVLAVLGSIGWDAKQGRNSSKKFSNETSETGVLKAKASENEVDNREDFASNQVKSNYFHSDNSKYSAIDSEKKEKLDSRKAWSSATYISNDGTYGIGVLSGTISQEYKAKYIGKAARARYREAQILALEEQIADLTAQLEETKAALQAIDLREKQLESEYKALPEGTALHEKAVELDE